MSNCTLDFSRPLIMGILNVTPDSFSDGGRYNALDAAVAHALEMVDEGADIIDIGGESTRPGAVRVDDDEQCRRAVPIIKQLRTRIASRVAISIDTTRSTVARAALDAGASMLNDVSAGREDPGLLQLAAERRVPICLMHMQGSPETMQDAPHYEDVTREVAAFLAARAQAAQSAGVSKDMILLDPGIGFGKQRAHNLELLARLARLAALGYPVLLGTSRKRFMGSICAVKSPVELGPATCATTALGVMSGASVFRVHDVRANRQAADVAFAIKQAASNPTAHS